MNVTLLNKNNSFLFNISPLMPISYLRTLANKSFNIPEYLIKLSYENINIEKQYNETSLKDYFSSSTEIKIEVTEVKTKNLFKKLLNTTLLKSSKILKDNKEEKKSIKQFDITKTHFDFENNNNSNYSDENLKKEKCEQCNKRPIEIFCREDCKFICKICFDLSHNNHKYIKIEKGNIEQSGYFYQKELLKDLNNQEEEIKEIIQKSSHERLNEKIEQIYDIVEKLNKQEREIMENFPSIPIETIINTDYGEIKKNIYSIKENFEKKNPFSINDKKPFFKLLQNEDFKLDSFNKDIKSIKKKYDFQDMLIEIIDSINKLLNELYDSLRDTWNKCKYNLLLFESEIEKLSKKCKKKFIIDDDFVDDEDEEKIENGLEAILFESKNGNNKNKNLILPKLNLKNHNPSFKITNNLTNGILIKTRRRLKSNQIKGNNLLNSFSNSESSLESFSENNSIKKEKNKTERNERYSNRDSNRYIQLDQVLLSDKKGNNSPKRPRKNSIRMSIFTKNMNKVDTLTNKIMKVKKKKKKYT